MTRALADQSRAVLAMHEAGAEPEQRVTAEEWLAAERAARVADDPHREIADADLHQDHAGSDDARHDEQVNSDQDQREDGDPVEASRRTEPLAEEPQAEDDDADEVEPQEDKRPETDVPDVRDLDADEETVRPVERDESEVELSRARRSVVEVANRRELEHQHERDERVEQLANWQGDDRQVATDEPFSVGDEDGHDFDDY